MRSPSKPFKTNIFLKHFRFTEGIRWHDNKLWFCDLWDKTIYCFNESGKKHQQIHLQDEPVGLGWLSDGRMLITSLYERSLLIYEQKAFHLLKDLSCSTPGYCHDLTVSNNDIAYISRSGFYPSPDAKIVHSEIYMLYPDNRLSIAAENIGYPNGMDITPDGKTLFVSETFADTISTFDIDEQGQLFNQRTLIQFDTLGFQVSFTEDGIPQNRERMYPDGLCYDKKRALVWVASPGQKVILGIDKNGTISETIHTRAIPFDCVIGGQDLNTIYIASSQMSRDDKTGMIESLTLI